MKTYELETETIKEKIVTLEERSPRCLAGSKRGDMHFNHLSGTNHARDDRGLSRNLHLAREQLVLLEQMDNFSD